MSAYTSHLRQTEQTEVGEQTLMSGIAPISLPVSSGAKLTARTTHPMVPKRNPNAVQKSCDIGLFDEVGRAQIDLCDLIAEMETKP